MTTRSKDRISTTEASTVLMVTSSPMRGRRCTKGAYTRMEGPHITSAEGGTNELRRKIIPGDRRLSGFTLSEVGDDARS
jgi:hypothetical protein